MSGGKETPRQKLIGLMYLVLMALLAMNTSKQVILAFITLNDKIESTIDIVASGTENQIASFDSKLVTLAATGGAKKEIESLKELQKQALVVSEWTRVLSNEFVKLTSDIVVEAGDGGLGVVHEGDPVGDKHYTIETRGDKEYFHLLPMEHLTKKDDYDTPSRMFIGINGDAKNPEGGFILDSIRNYRDRICKLVATHKGEKAGEEFSFEAPEGLSLADESDKARKEFNEKLREGMGNVDPKDTALIFQLFNILTPPDMTVNHGESIPYISKMFDHAPLVAAAAMFTSMRADLATAENKVINHIAGRVSVETFNFNKIEPLAFSGKSLIEQGDSLNLKVMIAAYDTTKKMELQYWIDDSTKSSETQLSYEGKATDFLKVPSTGGGKHIVYGNIAVEVKGNKEWKPWKYDYFVNTGGTNATVSPVDLNVLYTGWDNRMKVSAGGVPQGSKISASCSGCSSFSQKGDYWIAKVKKVGSTCTITVKATTPDGQSISLGEPAKFRVFSLPSAQPFYAGKSFESTSMPVATARAVPPLQAKLPNSPLDVKYTVTSFQMLVIKGGKAVTLKSKSNKLTGKMKGAIKAMGKGSILSFTNIKAKGPSGKARPIGNLTYVLY